MASTPLKTGQLIDQRFLVESALGQGSLGSTYRCRNLRNDSIVAVKLLGKFIPETADRAPHREFSNVLRLRHPTLVSVDDFGRFEEGGCPYLVREYVDGQNLLEGTSGRPTTARILLLAELCRAVRFLHDRGVAHGALKPGNVLLEGDAGGGERLRVLDFGLAPLLAGAGAPFNPGTLAYVAPEVLMGQKAGTSSDLYSLGILFYEVLVRRRPFADEDPGYLIQKHLQGQADLHPLESLEHGAGLARVIRALLDKDPKRRPSSAEELVGLLRSQCGLDLAERKTPAGDLHFSSGILVGREKELEVLRQRARQVRDSKRGWTVFILGEEGSAKSRCMEELSVWARLEGWHVVQGKCIAAERRLRGPYREILDSTGPVRGERTEDAPGPYRTRELADAGSALSPEQVGDSSPSRFLDGVAGEIVAKLSSGPTLVFLHDFHWADEATVAILEYLVYDVLAHPILLCVSALEGEVEGKPVGRLIARTTRQLRGETLTLDPLGKDAIIQLILSLTGEVQNARRLGEWVSRHVGGNPFFIGQTLEHLVERGILARESGRWRITRHDLERLKAPESVSSIMRERLARLNPRSRELANWLAVVNRPASEAFLESIGAARHGELKSWLEELVNRQIVRTFEGLEGRTYAFVCASFADVVLDDLPQSGRRSMHQSVGLKVEEQGTSADPVEIAAHLIEGQRGKRAVDYALKAEAACKAEYANEMTLRFARFVLDEGTHLPASRLCEVAIDAAEASSAVGDPGTGIRILKRRMKASARASRIVRARLLMQLAYCYQHLGRLPLLDEAGRKALVLLGDDHSELADMTRAIVYRHLAYSATVRYRHVQGLGYLEKALEDLGRHGLAESVLGGRILCPMAAAHWMDSNWRASVAAARKAVAILQNTSSLTSLSQAHSILGMGMIALGKFGLAIEQEEKAVAVAARSRSSTTRIAALADLMESLCRSGRIRDALAMSDQLLEAMTEVRNPMLVQEGYAVLAEARLAAGDYAGAGDILRRLGTGPELRIPAYSWGQIMFLNAWLDRSLGNDDSALAHLDELKRLHDEKGPVPEFESGEALRAAILHSRGRKAEAKELLLALDSELRRRGLPYQSCIVNLELAELLLGDGELDRAGRSIRCALKLSAAMPSRHLNARAHMLKARLKRMEAASTSSGPGEVEGGTGLPEARTEIDAALKLAEEAGVDEMIWQAHVEGSRVEELAMDWRAAADHSAKALEGLERVRERAGPVDTAGFLGGLGRAAARSECESRLGRIRVMHAPESPRAAANEETYLRLLQRVISLVSGIRQRDAMLESLSNLVVQVTGMRRAMIFLRETGSDRLRMPTLRTAGQQTMKSVDAVSRSVIDGVNRRGEPFITADAKTDQRLAAERPVAAVEIGAIFCGPLRAVGRTLGVLYADHPSSMTEIDESTISLFASCCDLAATAISGGTPAAEPAAPVVVTRESAEESERAFPEIVGCSEAMRQLRKRISSVAASPLDVLITGESGTGKELVARAVHRTSTRSKGRFLAVDCGSLADSLAESEFFGYRKGAFTGAAEDRAGLIESADGGTLFLDEISNLSNQLQGKLLRVLQEREIRRVGDPTARRINVRVVAATNRNLPDAVARGEFRRDLYYRLNGMGIDVPALRVHPEDVPLLLEHFLAQSAHRTGGQAKAFSPRALELLKRYGYPGNVRELINVVGNGYYSAPGNVIDTEHLPPEIRQAHVAQLLGETDEARAREIYRAIRDSKGDFEAFVRAPFNERRISREVVLGVIRLALADTRGRYRDALGLLGVQAGDYHGTMTYLKRHDCRPDYRQFRHAGSVPHVL